MHWLTYRLRADWRQRWRAWTGLALLLGIGAGLVAATAIAASRTSSAYERFATRQHAADALVTGACGESEARRDAARVPRCVAQAARLSSVTAASATLTYSAYVETLDGRSLQPDDGDPCYSGPGEVSVEAVAAGFRPDVNRARIIAGRAAVPGSPDEVVLSETVARRLALGPGDRLRVHLFSTGDAAAEDDGGCLDTSTWHRARTVVVVGITRTPYEIEPQSGLYRATVQATPAFARAVATGARSAAELVVRVRDGQAGIATLERQLEALDGEYEVVALQPLGDAVEKGLEPYTVALTIVAILAAIAVTAVLVPSWYRQQRFDAVDASALHSLGATGPQLRALAVGRALVVGGVATVVGTGVAAAVSPLALRGQARRIDPEPGVVLAAPPLLVMAGALLGVGVVIAIVAARAARGRRTGARRSRLGARLATLGAPPVALVGAQFAFPSDRTRGARSTRAGIAGVTIAVVATIAALTFSAGLGHLLATPALRGQTFDAYAWYPSLETPDGEPRPVPAAEVERFFAEQEAVDVATFGAISFPGGEAMTIGDRKAAVPLAAFDVGGGAIEPAIVSGRAPRERSEIALGEATQAELHVSVGDTVEAHGSTGDWETRGRRTSASFVVVGTAVYPVQGSDEGLGRGAFVTLEGARALYPHAEVVSVFIRLASGGDLVRLAAEYELAYPHTALVPLDELSHVVNALEVQQVDATPLVLAGIVALMAIGVLCNMLFGVVRAHRRDLAVLAALGMRPPQLRRAVAVSASLLTLLALAIGVPVGLALGRTVWLRYARSLHVVRVGVVPWFGLFEVVLTALVLANLAAFAASFVSSRAAARSALRTE